MNHQVLVLKDSVTGETIKAFSSTSGSVKLGRGGRNDTQCHSLSSGQFRADSPGRGSKVMSKDHAQLTWEQNELGAYPFLTDLGSTNGTLVERDGEANKLNALVPYRLKEDDVVTFGRQMAPTDSSPSYLPMTLTVAIKSPHLVFTDAGPIVLPPVSFTTSDLLQQGRNARSVPASRTATFTDQPRMLDLRFDPERSSSPNDADSDDIIIEEPSDELHSSAKSSRSYGLSEADLLQSDYESSVLAHGFSSDDEDHHDDRSESEAPAEERSESEAMELEEEEGDEDDTQRYGGEEQIAEEDYESVGVLSPAPERILWDNLGPFEMQEQLNDAEDADGDNHELPRQSSPELLPQQQQDDVGTERLPSPVSPQRGESPMFFSTSSPEPEASERFAATRSMRARLTFVPKFRQNFEKSAIAAASVDDDAASQHSHLPSPSSSPPRPVAAELLPTEEKEAEVTAQDDEESMNAEFFEVSTFSSEKEHHDAGSESGIMMDDDVSDREDKIYDEPIVPLRADLIAKLQEAVKRRIDDVTIALDTQSSTSGSRKRSMDSDDSVIVLSDSEASIPSIASPSALVERKIAPLPKRRGLHVGSTALGFFAGVVLTIAGLSSLDV